MLERSFGTKSIFRLWGTKKIPRYGTIVGDVTYELHGVGCRLYLPEICIDFDYGPDGRVDGFDVWRLYMYACELPHRYKIYTNKETLDHDFNEYLKLGKAKRIPGSMSRLYFIQS